MAAALHHPEVREACVAALTAALAEFEREDIFVNSEVARCLMELGAVEAAPLIKAVYASGRVDDDYMTDWEDIQIELGLLTARKTPRRAPEVPPWLSNAIADSDKAARRQQDEQHARAEVERFHSDPDVPFTLAKLRGFLFVLACAPELLTPVEWLPDIVGERDVAGQTDSLGLVMGLVTLYHRIDATVADADMPEGITFRADPLSNLDDDAEAAQWSRGFLQGHRRARDIGYPLSSDMSASLAEATAVLGFFGTHERADTVIGTLLGDEATLEQGTAMAIREWPRARALYATLGADLYRKRKRANMTRPKYTGPLPYGIGMALCPCRSGERFDRCCGADGS